MNFESVPDDLVLHILSYACHREHVLFSMMNHWSYNFNLFVGDIKWANGLCKCRRSFSTFSDLECYHCYSNTVRATIPLKSQKMMLSSFEKNKYVESVFYAQTHGTDLYGNVPDFCILLPFTIEEEDIIYNINRTFTWNTIRKWIPFMADDQKKCSRSEAYVLIKYFIAEHNMSHFNINELTIYSNYKTRTSMILKCLLLLNKSFSSNHANLMFYNYFNLFIKRDRIVMLRQ